MKRVLAIGWLVWLMGAPVLKGQSTLNLDSANVVYTYQVTFNSTDYFRVILHNSGPQTYSGTVHVVYAVDSAANGGMLQLQQLADDSLPVYLVAGDTISESHVITISPSLFKHGINTVVIWPRMSSTSPPFLTGDSLKIPILVDTVAGIHDLSLTLGAHLFPNPAQQILYVQVKDPDKSIERVSFLTIEERLIREMAFTGKLDVGDLPAGVYFVELTGSKGRLARYKIIKE